MRTRIRRLLIAALAALMVGTLPVTAGARDDGDRSAAIRLRAATFTPADGERPAIPADLRRDRAEARQTDVYLVQFDGPIATSTRGELSSAGIEVLSYIPDFAFRVRASTEAIAAAEARTDVVFVDLFQPAYKLDPAIGSDIDMGVYRVRLLDGSSAQEAGAAIRQAGVAVLASSGRYLTVSATADQLGAVAGVSDVAWLSPLRFNETHNEYGAGVIMGATDAAALGYDGSTQIVAVADTGLGDGTTGGAHRDIPADRIVAIHDWPTSTVGGCYRASPDGAQDVDSGHGTHVAGSVLSDGGPNSEGQGTAPAARLVFQAVEDWIRTGGVCSASPSGYYLTGLPDDLAELFQQAYDDGARIHSNSWGSDVDGDYTSDAATVDTFMWDNPDMLITTSAGNQGIDEDSNGVVDDDSIGSPATAKNLLTVGASEGDRQGDWACDGALTYENPNTGTSCAGQGGVNDIFTWGDAWPDDFPADPVASDASAGNAEQMAAFSSRGPTDDGRIKPDVVAPGSWILSGYSDLYQEGYDAGTNPQNGAFQYDGWGFPIDEHYKYMGGTSMSNPLTAGAAAVVRDFYEKSDGHSASAALAKASLINSAVDMLDENNDGVDDNDYPIPNSHEGWGRVDVGAAVDGTAAYVDGDTSTTGASTSYTHSVEAGTPLKVTLVWTDYPSDEAAAVNLVNDLDLVVTGPGGETYLGNVFSGGWAATGGSADRINNVENVYVQAPAAGEWTVEVSGFNVPFGPQPFALVIDAAFDGAPPVDTPPTVSVDAPVDGAMVSGTVDLEASASDDVGVDQVEFFVDGVSVGVDSSAPYVVGFDTTTVGDGSVVVEAVATDTIGQTASDSISVTVDNVVADDPPTVSVDAPVDGAMVSGTVDLEASASDDVGVDQVEFFVDGVSVGVDSSAPYVVGFDTTTVGDGSVVVEAVATDTIGQTASDSISVTVDNSTGEGSTMHIGDLDGVSVDAGGRWTPEVTVMVHDDNEAAVDGATVTVTLTASNRTFGGSCTTDATGTCTIVGPSVPDSRVDIVTLTVDDVTHGSLAYAAAGNHDPDGDSDGTEIVVAQ